MSDPTYNKDKINAVPEWKLAWELSEIDNDLAPIEWSRYIPTAKHLLNKYYLEEKKISYQFTEEPSVQFKVTAEHFRTLMTGNIVTVTNNSSSVPVKFFMDDIGIDALQYIFDAEMNKLYNILQGKQT